MSAFMIPVAEYLSEAEAREYIYEPGLADGGDPDEPVAGFYGRLSAPGYMDCTDWDGPYDRAWKALRAVCDMYEVGTDGEERVS